MPKARASTAGGLPAKARMSTAGEVGAAKVDNLPVKARMSTAGGVGAAIPEAASQAVRRRSGRGGGKDPFGFVEPTQANTRRESSKGGAKAKSKRPEEPRRRSSGVISLRGLSPIAPNSASMLDTSINASINFDGMDLYESESKGIGLIGRPIAKDFDGKVFSGSVIAFDDSVHPPVYRVRYEDGDEEEIEEADIAGLLAVTGPPMGRQSTGGARQSTGGYRRSSGARLSTSFATGESLATEIVEAERVTEEQEEGEETEKMKTKAKDVVAETATAGLRRSRRATSTRVVSYAERTDREIDRTSKTEEDLLDRSAEASVEGSVTSNSDDSAASFASSSGVDSLVGSSMGSGVADSSRQISKAQKSRKNKRQRAPAAPKRLTAKQEAEQKAQLQKYIAEQKKYFANLDNWAMEVESEESSGDSDGG